MISKIEAKKQIEDKFGIEIIERPLRGLADVQGYDGHCDDPLIFNITFDNGFGASIIRHNGSYGGTKGLFELAVLKEGKLNYDTPITDDVFGHLEFDELLEYIVQIKDLKVIENEQPTT